eukprot:tig00020601_g11728.t1
MIMISTSTVGNTCTAREYASGQTYNTTACLPAKLLCYSQASCAGTPTVSSDFTKYKDTGVSTADSWARCPPGTLSYKNAGVAACATDVVKGAKCYKARAPHFPGFRP